MSLSCYLVIFASACLEKKLRFTSNYSCQASSEITTRTTNNWTGCKVLTIFERIKYHSDPQCYSKSQWNELIKLNLHDKPSRFVKADENLQQVEIG